MGYTYEVLIKDYLEPDVINNVTEVVQNNSTYNLYREDLLLYSAPIEQVVYLKIV